MNNKKNSVRLVCTSPVNAGSKSYAIVPVKINDKKLEYTQEELEAIKRNILEAEAKSVANEVAEAEEAPIEEAVEAEEIVEAEEAPIEEAVEAEEIVEAEEAPIEEAIEADEVAEAEEAPIEEAIEADEIVEAEEAPIEEAVEADEIVEAEEAPIEEAVEAEEIVEAEEAPIEEAVEAEEIVEAEEAPVEEAIEADEIVEAEEAPIEEAEATEETTGEKSEEIIEIQPLKKKRRGLSLTTKKALSGWLFVLPFVLGVLLIYAPIVADSIIYSFASDNSIGTGSLDFIGFSNYAQVWTGENLTPGAGINNISSSPFSATILNSVKDLLIQIPAIVIFSLFMAMILNQKMAGRTFFRAIFFLPVILGTGVISSMDAQSAFANQLNSTVQGGTVDSGTGDGGMVSALDIEMLLSNIKLGTELVEIVTTLINNIFEIVSRSGVQMLIFLSGLQSISPSIYESCQVEGASSWETFWKITLPMISPMILVNAIYTVIDLFTAPSNDAMAYIDQMFGYGRFGWSAAMSWIYMLVVLAFIVIVALIMKTVVFYQRRD